MISPDNPRGCIGRKSRLIIVLAGWLSVISCAHVQTPPKDFAYDDPSSLTAYAFRLTRTAAFKELPGKKWGELALWTIEYRHEMPGFEPEQAAVTFIERPSITTNADGFIEYNILTVKFTRKPKYQLITTREVYMPPNDEAERIKQDLTVLENFKEPNFYRDIAAQAIIAHSTNADIQVVQDLKVQKVEYEYFSRPQIALVEFEEVGTIRKTGKREYTWKTKTAKLLPSGDVVEAD
jgi:hypothetical protein